MHIQASRARTLVGQGAVVLDVRNERERAMGAIPHSIHIPLDELASRADELPTNHPVVCQCASGARSAAAMNYLRRRGYEAYNLHGGIVAWYQAGYEIVVAGTVTSG